MVLLLKIWKWLGCGNRAAESDVPLSHCIKIYKVAEINNKNE